jgi:hypothetical protein
MMQKLHGITITVIKGVLGFRYPPAKKRRKGAAASDRVKSRR